MMIFKEEEENIIYHWLDSHFLTNFNSYFAYLVVSLESYLFAKGNEDFAHLAISAALLSYSNYGSTIHEITFVDASSFDFERNLFNSYI